MRPAVALGAILSVVAIGLGISAVGRHLAGGDASPFAVEPEMPAPPDPASEKPTRAWNQGSEPPAQAAAPPASSDQRPMDAAGYTRVKPRAPLSDLGQAKPPRKKSEDWDGTNLFRPVANAAGVFESTGYTVTVAGTDIIDPKETCVFQGKSWPCGVLARTAFRSFLRGRAVTCALPLEGDQKSIAADCRVGKENVGEWLVSNGWARAAKNGPYGDAGKKAQSAGKGIFGPPPPNLE
jgi:endonuclease YncB( thermonuclease family)